MQAQAAGGARPAAAAAIPAAGVGLQRIAAQTRIPIDAAGIERRLLAASVHPAAPEGTAGGRAGRGPTDARIAGPHSTLNAGGPAAAAACGIDARQAHPVGAAARIAIGAVADGEGAAAVLAATRGTSGATGT